jgi:hypothetical protein
VGAAALLVGCPALLDDEFTIGDRSVAPPVTAGGTGGTGDGGFATSGGAGEGGTGESGAAGAAAGSAVVAGNGGTASGGAGGTASAGQGGSEQPPSDPLGVLKSALVNRYSFDGAGSSVLLDSVGGNNGSFKRVGAGAAPTLGGTGSLVLDGELYGELPSGLISSHLSVTIEAWVNWSGGSEWQWQRIFDFGSNENGAGQQGGDAHYLFLTPENASAITVAAYKGTDGGGLESHNVTLSGGFPQGVVQHTAVVVDGSNRRLYFYLNGAAQGFKPLSGQEPLAKIPDDNDWIGRSQSPDDPNFVGEILEFRIYDAALDEAAVALSYDEGPDAAIGP